MASKKDPYETKIIAHGFSGKKVRKLVEQGWEIVNQKGGALGTQQMVTLRRPNPKYKAPKGK